MDKVLAFIIGIFGSIIVLIGIGAIHDIKAQKLQQKYIEENCQETYFMYKTRYNELRPVLDCSGSEQQIDEWLEEISNEENTNSN